MRTAVVRLMQTIRALRRHSPSAVALAALAWVLVALSEVALTVLPFRRLAPVLGQEIGPAVRVPLASPTALRSAILIAEALSMASAHVPVRSDCLRQALAAALLCRLFGVPFVACLGASHSATGPGGPLSAHAWVQCGSVVVSGGTGNFRRLGVVTSFISHARPERRPPARASAGQPAPARRARIARRASQAGTRTIR